MNLRQSAIIVTTPLQLLVTHLTEESKTAHARLCRYESTFTRSHHQHTATVSDKDSHARSFSTSFKGIHVGGCKLSFWKRETGTKQQLLTSDAVQ